MRIQLLKLLRTYVRAYVRSGADKQDPKYRLGVGIMLVNREGKIFIGKDKKQRIWQMPQGGVDFYQGSPESFIDTAWRELWEEVGVSRQCRLLGRTRRAYYYDFPRSLKGKSKLWRLRFRGQKQRWYLFLFQGDDADINLNATSHPEFLEWQWVSSKDLPHRCVPFMLPVYRKVLKELLPILEKRILNQKAKNQGS